MNATTLMLSPIYIRGVVIEGQKWCGKTTTALQVSKSVIRMTILVVHAVYTIINIELSRLLMERICHKIHMINATTFF